MKARSLLLATGVLLALWQAAAMLLNTKVLPPPTTVMAIFVRDLPGALGGHLVVSTYRVLISIVLAVVIGAPIGLLLGQSRRFDRFGAPLLYVTYPIPKVVLLPIVLLFLGLGDVSKIFLITLILLYQVVIVVRDASVGVRPELIASVRSLGGNGFDLFRYVYVPACLPAILTSLRVSAGTAIAALYLTETFATRAGLGFYIMDSWSALSYPRMYSAVVAMSLLGLAIYVGLDQIEQRACAWTRAA